MRSPPRSKVVARGKIRVDARRAVAKLREDVSMVRELCPKFDHEMYLMQSNGGITTSRVAKERPVLTLNSGVVGGVIGTMAGRSELHADP